MFLRHPGYVDLAECRRRERHPKSRHKLCRGDLHQPILRKRCSVETWPRERDSLNYYNVKSDWPRDGSSTVVTILCFTDVTSSPNILTNHDASIYRWLTSWRQPLICCGYWPIQPGCGCYGFSNRKNFRWLNCNKFWRWASPGFQVISRS